jgi:hypothetical protein
MDQCGVARGNLPDTGAYELNSERTAAFATEPFFNKLDESVSFV